MKIAVIYNRSSQQVINLFGIQSKEKYALESIRRIVDALKKAGHQVATMEGDKELIHKLEEFMPRVLKGERPGIAFNLSYGIQGQARYTHVPGILEMLGIPYVGSGPLAHSLALDKVVAKMLFKQNGLPTPDFAVLDSEDFEMPGLPFPLIVKPKNEAVSMGTYVVHNEEELRKATGVILKDFQQSVLVEQYIDGTEVNVGLLGNNPPETFEPAELIFGEGPKVYSYEDKIRQSGREIKIRCPARIPPEQAKKAQELAGKAFKVLGCYDCARVDMRLDPAGNIYLLEINSLPSLGEHGSYTQAAQAMGLDLPKLVNRMVEVASARYFGTPSPPELKKETESPQDTIFQFLTKRRDRLEQRVENWVRIHSRSNDPVGIKAVAGEIHKIISEINLHTVKELTDFRDVWTWETNAGLEQGTLLICHVDVPVNPHLGAEHFHRDPEWLYGEGVGCSRAPLVSLEYVLRALRYLKVLSKTPLGVLCYADEGRNCEKSEDVIRQATQRVKRVLVLNSGNQGDKVVIARRGQQIFRLQVEGKPMRLGQTSHTADVMRVLFRKLEAAASLSLRKERIAVSLIDLKPEGYPRLLPHRATAYLQVSYPDQKRSDGLREALGTTFVGEGLHWDLTLVADRPPMVERSVNVPLLNILKGTAQEWGIPLTTESSLWPSVAGLVDPSVPVLCGIGPVAVDLFTSKEKVSRISLLQRTLLLAQLLLKFRGT